jgi:hypothetical protein
LAAAIHSGVDPPPWLSAAGAHSRRS